MAERQVVPSDSSWGPSNVAAHLDSTICMIERLARLYPHYGQSELLRMGLLLTLHLPQSADQQVDAMDGQLPVSDHELRSLSQEISLQLNAAGDQHAAVADELDSLAATAPCDFSPTHVFTLVRAIKVQSQVLNFYLGPV